MLNITSDTDVSAGEALNAGETGINNPDWSNDVNCEHAGRRALRQDSPDLGEFLEFKGKLHNKHLQQFFLF
jgi:hypothetical protein